MKNITVSVKDEVYRQARITAARMGTTVSAMVARYLLTVTGNDEEKQRDIEDRNKLMEELLRRSAGFSLGTTPTRSEMHER